MSAAFAEAIAATLQSEGGYVNDPDDPGGETRFGISKRSYPNEDILGLTLERAAEIYRRDYWQKPGFDLVAAFAPAVAIRLFDLGVNCGPPAAVKMLQRGLNVLCADVPARRLNPWREKIAGLMGGKALLVDGRLGPITLKIMSTLPHKSAILAALKGEAYNHYAKLNPIYRVGWLERLER